MESHYHKSVFWDIFALFRVSFQQGRLRIVMLVLRSLKALFLLEVFLLPSIEAFEIALDLVYFLTVIEGRFNASNFKC